MRNLKLTQKRGDSASLKIILDSDYSSHTLSFVVKESTDLTADRLIEKLTASMIITYDTDADKSIILIPIEPEDTADLEAKEYLWDLLSVAEDKTIAGGAFSLIADVQTPFDGFALPESAVRFQQVDAANGAVNDIAIIKEVDGVKYYEFISPADYAAILKQILDNL